jgi:hypothetical protein
MRSSLLDFKLCICAAAALLLIACPAPSPACTLQDTADHSQRRLPFPERQPSIPDVHHELLRRLREVLQQEKVGQQPSSSNTSPQTEPTTAESATPPVTPDELSKTGQALGDILNRIPPEIVPKGLPDLSTPQLQQSLQNPETQQSLKKLLEQFRKDGVLPPSQPNGTPTPTPPIAENTTPQNPEILPEERDNPAPESAYPQGPPLPGSSLRQLEKFLQELQNNSPAPPVQPESPSQAAPLPNSPPNTAPQTIPRNPLRRRDRKAATPPAAPPSQTTPSNPDNPDNTPSNRGPSQPAPTPTPNPSQKPSLSPNSNTGRNRSFLESLEQLLQQPPGKSDKISENTNTPQPPDSDPNQTPPSFSIPDFLRRQFQDPSLRQQENPSTPQPLENQQPSDSSRPLSNSDQRSQPTPTPTPNPNPNPNPTPTPNPTPAPELQNQPDPSNPVPQQAVPQQTPAQSRRNRAQNELPLNQSFGESFRQLLNEARQEAREPSEINRIQTPSQGSPPARPQQTPATPPPRPPENNPGRADSMLRLLNDLSKDADRRTIPRTEVPDRSDRQQPVDPSALDWLLNNPDPERDQSPSDPGERDSQADAATGDSVTGEESAVSLPTSAIAIAGLLALGLITAGMLLHFANRRRLEGDETTARVAPLGPDQIRERRDVVAAFHQLARRSARSFRPWWHHQQIEELLIQAMPGRKSAIVQLAGVYEQSRYSPETLSLSETDLQQARDALRECQNGPR